MPGLNRPEAVLGIHCHPLCNVERIFSCVYFRLFQFWSSCSSKVNDKIAKSNESLDVEKLNEKEIKSDEEFREWATKVLKKIFKDDYDEEKAKKTIDGLLKSKGTDEDYGALIGKLRNG